MIAVAVVYAAKSYSSQEQANILCHAESAW